MRNIKKYYDNTESEKPRNNVKYFVNKIKKCGKKNKWIYHEEYCRKGLLTKRLYRTR